LLSGINNAPFHRHQEEQTTLRIYEGQVVGLLAMMLRPKITYNLILPNDIASSLEDLRAALLSKTDAQLATMDLLVRLWTRPWPKTSSGDVTDPTIRYIVLHCLCRDGSFIEPKLVTGVFAKFEYCMRGTFLSQTNHLVNQGLHASVEEAAQSLAPWHREKVESTFNSIRSLQHRASAIAFATQSMPRIWWTDRNTFKSMLYKGHPVHFDDFKTVFLNLETDAVNIWENDILCGLELNVVYNLLSDDLTDREVGYSMFSDPRNNIFLDRDRLMRGVLHSPELRKKFVTGINRDGFPIWSKIALRGWLYSYAKHHGIHLVRTEMLGGAPGRLTELTAMLYNNSKTDTRHMFRLDNHLAMLRKYQKGSAITGQDKTIPHSMDAFTADMTIQDIALARPFAELAVSICFPGNKEYAEMYQHFMWVNNTKLFTTADISTIMSSYTLDVIGMSITVNPWRHISCAFKRKLCPRLSELTQEDELDNITALQAGRSRATENRIYGLTPDALLGASEDILPLYLDASTDWQIEFGIVPGGACISYRDAKAACFDKLAGAKAFKVSQDLPVGNRLCEERIAELVFAKLKAILPITNPATIHDAVITHSVADYVSPASPALSYVPDTTLDGLQADLDGLGLSSAMPTRSPSPTMADNDDDVDVALSGLRQALNNPMASWRSDEQRTAVKAVLALQSDVLAVLPTGSGKTMLCIIPSLVEDMITVVVLPLKSLITDYIRKLSSSKIPFEHFKGCGSRSISGRVNLVLVSIDVARTPHWKECLAHLHQRKKVARLVFDEGQFAVTGNDFRNPLKDVYEIRSIPMQLVIMSGTIPPKSEPEIMASFNLAPNTLVIRTCTDRPELEYVVHSRCSTNQQVADNVEALVIEQLSHFEQRDRILIFVPYLSNGRELATQLGCDFYGGGKGFSDMERETMYHRWIQGRTKVMVCTSAFGAGNDYSHTRLVIHAGTPLEMIGFVQEMSRGGRDDQHAACHVFPRGNTKPVVPPNSLDHKGTAAVYDFVYGLPDCLRYKITLFSDGIGVRCSEKPGSYRCGQCKSMHLSPCRAPDVLMVPSQ
jgi:DEAD/DEAH box helicase/Helicase conserved C-terminal domain